MSIYLRILHFNIAKNCHMNKKYWTYSLCKNDIFQIKYLKFKWGHR